MTLEEEFKAYLQQASTAENPIACYQVGRCFELGLGTAIRKEESDRWYERALSRGWNTLLNLAQTGHAKAQFIVGRVYNKGQGKVIQNNTEAVKWCRLAADQGYADAQHSMGFMYQHGCGVAQNDTEAVRWYRLAADQGYANAQHSMGFMYRHGRGVARNDIEAVRWYRLAADQGYAKAQHSMGFMYRYGRGVSQNDIEVVRWYRLAADQGYAKAQHSMGFMYEHGRGVAQNNTEAVRWYRLAADQGYANAQYNLGLMYEHGRGVAQNDTEAVKWYRLAANQGDAFAQTGLGLMYEHGRGVAQNDIEAVKWYRLAANQGDAFAQTGLGLMYQDGRGVSQNDREAVRWYRLAADQGFAVAQTGLGLMYQDGRGVSQNDREAVKWYRLAADQGNAYAQASLGFMYEHGRGVAQNDIEAVKWYRLAADQGLSGAQYNLGCMYRDGGLGVAKDETQAVWWYRKAAAQGFELATSALKGFKVTSSMEEQILRLEREESRKRALAEERWVAEERQQQAILRMQGIMTRAQEAYHQGDYVKTILGCVEGLSLDSRCVELLRLKGLAYYRQGAYREGQLAFLRWSEIEPKSNAWLWQILCRWKKHAQDEAVIELSLAEVNQGLAETRWVMGYLVKGILLNGLGQYREAKQAVVLYEEGLLLASGAVLAEEAELLHGLLEELQALLKQASSPQGLSRLPDQRGFQGTPRHQPSVSVVPSVPVEWVTAVVLYDYTGTSAGHLSVQAQSWVEVITEYDSGWWWCRQGCAEGLLPSMYLQKQRGPELTTHVPPSQGDEATYSAALLNQHWAVRPEELEQVMLVGRGGCGAVYKAKWKETTVAAKKLHGGLNPKAIVELHEEAEIMSRLHHPNVIHLFGVTHQEPFYLVMEWMSKGSLHQVLATESLAFRQRLKLVKQTASGLAFLHSKSIVHRDLKSLNVLVDKHYRAKVADFGLSIVKQSARSTRRDGSVGTLQWRAPELFKMGGKHTPKSDVYSLGMVLWEGLTGRFPYEAAEDDIQITFHVQQGGREEIPEDTPGWYSGLIQRCWDANPAQRPTAAEVAQVLQDALKRDKDVQVPHQASDASGESPGSRGFRRGGVGRGFFEHLPQSGGSIRGSQTGYRR